MAPWTPLAAGAVNVNRNTVRGPPDRGDAESGAVRDGVGAGPEPAERVVVDVAGDVAVVDPADDAERWTADAVDDEPWLALPQLASAAAATAAAITLTPSRARVTAKTA